MALPTMAQWTDAWAKLTVFPALGTLYAEQSHIFRAFGVPERIEKGQVKINWTDGATAGSVQTGAGAPQASGVAPAQVTATYTKDFAGIGSQAYTDIGVDLMGSGFEENLSIMQAMLAIYRQFVTQIVGSNDGTDYKLWGAANFYGLAKVISAGMINTTGGLVATLIDQIDDALASLPSSGYNICLTDKQGYNALKKQIRALGGTTPDHTSLEDFGFETLTYDGCAFFHCSQMATTGTCPTTDSGFYFYNIGPEGVQVVFPGLEDPWIVQGPKMTSGYFNETWDIALGVQVIYTSPRASYQLHTDIA